MPFPANAVVASVDEYLAWLTANLAPDTDHWFRGLPSDGWDLSASVFRTPARRQHEQVLLKRFIQDARRHLEVTPDNFWDWLFLAQHHLVPTRLLDWSENALVGLYFAAQDHLDLPGDPLTARKGRVWLLRPTSLNDAGGFVFSSPRDVPLFGIDSILEEYHPFKPVPHQLRPIAALAPRSFARISAQWGTFTIANFPDALDAHPHAANYLHSLEVPVAAKATIRAQLAVLGLEDRTIYPDLFRLGLKLTEVYG
jgi:hypothetical protein